MKNLIITLVIVIYAPFSFGQTPEQKKMIGSALANYSKVAGAWYLNKRCKFLDNEKLKIFEKDVAAITIALSNDLRGSNILNSIQVSAKKVAESDQYAECGDELKKNIVDWGVNYAENWSLQIKKIQTEQNQ